MVDKDFTGVAATHNKDDAGNITRKYVGDHLNGLEHGIGVYEARFNTWKGIRKPIHRFAGQFVEGKCSGLGMKSFFEGDELFCGEYLNDLRNGIGYWRLRTGAVFIGEFKNHVPFGFGTIIGYNGYKFTGNVQNWWAIEGQWFELNNEPVDITSDGFYHNGHIYVGDRLPNVQDHTGHHGEGRMDYNNGEYYVGSWVNGKKHGYGEMLHFDLSLYKGEWENDRKNGLGVMEWPNGGVYTGMFKDDRQYGKGVMVSPDGKEYELEF